MNLQQLQQRISEEYLSQEHVDVNSNVKNVIEYKDWMNRIDNSKMNISKDDLNKLIMNFFLVEGYQEAAEKFQKESGTQISEFDLQFMQTRLKIRQLIHAGKIDDAIQSLHEINPHLLEQNNLLLFNLLLQKLIELIKLNEVENAIEFAKNKLLPLAINNKELMNQLEQVMSLLAFQDIQKCPLSELAQNSQRIKVSSEVNYEMLKSESNSKDKESKLPTLLKMLLWSQKQLCQKFTFPTIQNLATAQFVDPIKKISIDQILNIEQLQMIRKSV